MLDDILRRQAGVLARRQARTAGLTPAAIRKHLSSGRWQTLHEAVYAAFSGPVPRASAIWAAALRAGPGAVLSHETAAELVGICAERPVIHVTVPSQRRLLGTSGLKIHYSSRVEAIRHPTRTPPQTRVEETVVDLFQTAQDLDEAVGWMAKACGSRLTTPQRILAAAAGRKKIRWRAELVEALTDVAAGCHSILERRYLHRVEHPHGLPQGHRQVARPSRSTKVYDDIRYDAGVIVELDGRVGHPNDARWREMRRDNEPTATGARVLRYGWTDVTSRPCEVAAQVGSALRVSGWTGTVRRCGTQCMILSV